MKITDEMAVRLQNVRRASCWLLLALVAIPLVAAISAHTASAQGLDNRLRDIRVEGAQRIEADTVRS